VRGSSNGSGQNRTRDGGHYDRGQDGVGEAGEARLDESVLRFFGTMPREVRTESFFPLSMGFALHI